MTKQKGFSLVELLVVVAIILVIAALAIPNFMRAKMAANESSAVESIRNINTAEAQYNTTYGLGFTGTLANLGGSGSTCSTSGATSTAACLIDEVLANNVAQGGKSGYTFTLGGGNASYTILGLPITAGQTGQRAFCSDQTDVIRYNVGGTACNSQSDPASQ